MSQPTAPFNGPKQVDPGWHALVGATVIVEAGAEPLEDATIVVRDGRVVSVSAGGEPPAGARVHDASGTTIYPALIEAFHEVELPAPESSAPGAHWNARVAAQRLPLDSEPLNDAARESMRTHGYAVAHLVPDDGVFRGASAIVTTGQSPSEAQPEANVLNRRFADVLSINAGGLGSGYPSSQMGVIALLRQTLVDASWHERASAAHERDPRRFERPAPNAALDALNAGRASGAPALWVAGDELEVLRLAKVAREFDRPGMYVGSGAEFRQLSAILDVGSPVIVPVTLPKTPRVETIADRHAVPLDQLMAWEQAPTNVRRLIDGGATVAITRSRLRSGEDFWKSLREHVEKGGLSEDDALAALTSTPARLLGVDDRFGSIERGKSASFVVVDKGSLFDKDRMIRETWVDGRRYVINAKPEHEFAGEYAATLGDAGEATVKVSGEKRLSVSIEIEADSDDAAPDESGEEGGDAADDAEGDDAEGDESSASGAVKASKVSQAGNRLSFVTPGERFGADGAVTFTALLEGQTLHGSAVGPGGVSFTWRGTLVEDDAGGDEGESDGASDDNGDNSDDSNGMDAESDIPAQLPTPFGAFGFLPGEMPTDDSVVITNATIWTAADAGIIERGTIVVRDGRIAAVYDDAQRQGRQALPAGVRVIDAQGKHVTPGLIDCHSHTGISGGVNEATQSSTAEVRIFDVIDPNAIGWYRQLAGGITAVNQLHGSANAIGGQNSVVKLRWGAPHPDGMRYEGAASGIKFALGENVKQSNWGPEFNTRYPQTRMGVETFIVDRFIAAREYAAEQERWRTMSPRERENMLPPRRDLELEALAEVLAGDRLVHCHSYRQDEILMLCRVAERFGFRIGTFQHVLEGYKVAEAIRDHAIGGSSFSDWWAYKFEVIDAIPHNGAIMHDAGVIVSFNSDSNELARRMNAEAAKAVKYGGVEPNEALKFVTLNAAKQLRMEARTGSIEPGKDADLAIWSGPPLSTMSRCERTFVDGVELFSLERDAELRARAVSERERIIQKLIDDRDAKAAADAPEDASGERPGEDEAQDMVDGPDDVAPELQRLLDFLTAGADPNDPLAEYRAMRQIMALEQEYEMLIRNGMDPRVIRPGECGCGIHSVFSTGF